MLPDPGALEHFHFLRPSFALFLIPWLVMAAAQRLRQNERDRFGGIIAPHLLEHLRLRRKDSRWFNPRNLSTVFMILTLLLLMGPSWRQQPSPLSQDDAALVVLLDVSSSMQQQDVQPSRLRRAKQKVSDLLALRPDKKAALVVYSGTGHTVLSLTADRDIFEQYLAAISPDIMPRTGKFPEYALPLVDETLRESNAPATVVLFTDGLGSNSRQAFEHYFDTHSHQLVVVGVGTTNNDEGAIPLEDKSLQALADRVDGHYIKLSVDDADMRRVDRRVDNHYVVVKDSALPWLDSGYPLVFPALALFLMWFRKGWTLTWAWLLLPLVLASPAPPAVADEKQQTAGETRYDIASWFADLWLTGDQQGRLLMQWGRYREAAAHFESPMWKGMAYYYNEEFMLAAEYFSRSDSNDALFNEANARAQARDYVRAVNRYDRLLARAPDYPGASQNRQRVQAIINEINRLSESQTKEPGVSSDKKELSSDDAIPAQGAEETVWETAELVQFSADEILQDAATRDMWLRSVQQDPSNFLAIKFQMQLHGRTATGEPEP